MNADSGVGVGSSAERGRDDVDVNVAKVARSLDANTMLAHSGGGQRTGKTLVHVVNR